jgi:adenosylcobinamide kinase / adenosylcobinamide-phosphate guanylyltransferase
VTRRAVLVLGGARAGKSAFAIAQTRAAADEGARVAFVATARAGDAEMAARIVRHRAERPPDWATIEAPEALVPALAVLAGKVDVVVVDCLTVWVANLFGGAAGDAAPETGEAARVLGEARRLVEVVASKPYELILVSNEVGWGVHPETALGRHFRDALGLVNQMVASAADRVVLLVAGCPLWLKGAP